MFQSAGISGLGSMLAGFGNTTQRPPSTNAFASLAPLASESLSSGPSVPGVPDDFVKNYFASGNMVVGAPGDANQQIATAYQNSLSAPPQQTYGGSPYGGSPYGMSPYGMSPYGMSPYGRSPYGMSPYGRSPYGMSPYGMSPYGMSPYGGSPYGMSPYGGSPYGMSPYGGSPYGMSPYGGSPYGMSPYGGSPYGMSPYGGSPYGMSPYGGSPYGSRMQMMQNPYGSMNRMPSFTGSQTNYMNQSGLDRANPASQTDMLKRFSLSGPNAYANTTGMRTQ
jgi:hypothetical protein